MPEVSGCIEKIKYRNEENGYSVLLVDGKDKEHVLVGYFTSVQEGEYIKAHGEQKLHPVYGEQLFVTSYDLTAPRDLESVEKYLSSGAIKGIGASLAKRIVKKFKDDTMHILSREPERLAEIKGISERMARAIGEQVEARQDMQQAMLYLQKYGIGMHLGAKIYERYGTGLYSILAENPYRLAEDLSGVGFKTADDIARRIGILVNSVFRIQSGILYTLTAALGRGHLYLPLSLLLSEAAELLGVETQEIEEQLQDLQIEKKLVVKREGEEVHVYLRVNYLTELHTARMLMDRNIFSDEDPKRIGAVVSLVEKEEDILLDPLQKKAVVEAVRTGLFIITGGPGTGKTTVIKTIIRYFERSSLTVLLGAPTGRAAKRMSEATGREARTIHRLLEISGMPPEEDGDRFDRLYFERNEDNPLEADVIIIDEISMADIYLVHSLLKAVPVGTRLILVGDNNQLPSVGPGHVLRDLIDSGQFNTVRLHTIYRQAAESDIIVNAHKMINGEEISLSGGSRDFLFIRRSDSESVIEAMMTLLQNKIPPYLGISPADIQVMSPMRKGPLGVERLNTVLQERLNPPAPHKPELPAGDSLFREGDKVMQVKNNYQKTWQIFSKTGDLMEEGEGIYNGDMGTIRDINPFASLVTVEFDEGRIVEYSYGELGELELSYAITIHKSQGSEYPCVILPVYAGPRMLMTRNLLYTAVTRAKRLVTLVGSPETFYSMAANTLEMKRYSGLKSRIEEIAHEEN